MCEKSKYLNCNEIISVMDIVSRKKTNTIARNVTSNALIDCHNKKVRYEIDCFILYTVL